MLKRNSDPISHNRARSGMRGNLLVRLAAPTGALALAVLPPQAVAASSVSQAKAQVDSVVTANARNAKPSVFELDPQNIEPSTSVGQLLGTDGRARQEAAWSAIRANVYGQLGSTATKTGTVLQVVADVGVPSGTKGVAETRAEDQAAELTDMAAGQLTMEVGGGPAETYRNAGFSNMVLYVTEYATGTAPTVNFAQAVQPERPSQGQTLPEAPPYW